MYDDDLAHVHNVGFADYSLRAGPGLLAKLECAGMRDGTVVDLGCGGGQWLRVLSDAGYTAVGIEASQSFVRLARRQAPTASVRMGSIWNCELPRCRAMTALGEVLCYLPRASARRPSLRRLFARVHRSLDRGGLFIFDMLMKSDRARMEYRTWRCGESWAVLIGVKEEPSKGTLHRELITFRKIAGSYRRGLERHNLRMVSQDEIVRALRDIGFVVTTSKSYGQFKLPPRRTAFFARRR